MITRVRKSFIRITMIMLTLVLIIPLISLNIITAAFTYNNTKELLRQIAETEIFILEPKRMPDRVPPDEGEHNVGVVKQQNTAVTTSPPESQISVTNETTSKTTDVPSSSSSQNAASPKTPRTEVIRPQTTTAVTSITPEILTRPTRESFTGTEPASPPWGGGNYTRPNETHPWEATKPNEPPSWEYTRPTRPDFGNPNQDGHSFGDSIYGDSMLAFSGNFDAVLLASTFTFTDITSSTTTTATIASSQTAQNNSPENTAAGTFREKVFHKNMPDRNMPKMMSHNTIDHFIVYVDKSGTVTDVRGSKNYDIESCTELISALDSKSKYDGYYDSLQYVRKDYSEGAIIVLSDRQSDFDMMKRMVIVSSCVFILMEGIVFILTRMLTKRAMRPMQISYEKQQQFISDAGHELKTPLTVISANADILSDEIGENKWLSYIKSQAERMRILVQEMLDLTKITNSSQQVPQSRFNLSGLVENVALPFECQAFEQKKTFHIELDPDIEFLGNTERIRRMIGIFIDNAFKYSNENGTIKIILKSENNKKVLKIYNTGIGIKKEDTEKIFERFYRSDSSRSAQGSYGLGLAIAKSIADQHNIKIQVLSDYGKWVSFDLYL